MYIGEEEHNVKTDYDMVAGQYYVVVYFFDLKGIFDVVKVGKIVRLG